MFAMSERTLHEEDILKAAGATVNALAKYDLSCCLCGSMGCYFYGMKNRMPHDIDMLITSQTFIHPEEIKRLLVHTDSNFYRVASTNPLATYEVLWYRISERLSCKVDILVPGSLHLPRIPSERVVWRTKPGYSLQGASQSNSSNSGYPVMPLLPLLLLKVQVWHDCRNAGEQYKRQKVSTYSADIDEMLEIASEEVVRGGSNSGRVYAHVTECQGWIDISFLERTQGYVKEYSRSQYHSMSSRMKWLKLGLGTM